MRAAAEVVSLALCARRPQGRRTVKQVASSDVIAAEEKLDSRSIDKLLSFAAIGVKGQIGSRDRRMD